jgi:hypothetical protein
MALRGTRLAVGVLGGLLATATAFGDEVLLVGGGKITGTVVEKTKDAVVIEAAAGRISVPMRRVLRIVDPSSGIETYRQRAAALKPRDVDGWATLARWAAEQGLVSQSHEAWRKVLVADPFHPEANAAVGRAEPDRTWKATEDAYRAEGYEQFEGRWITPAERQALERERAAEEARERAVRESNEAEARAREAGARARDVGSAAPASDSGVTPPSPSDVLGPSAGPRPTETYFTEPARRPDQPAPAPRSGSEPTEPQSTPARPDPPAPHSGIVPTKPKNTPTTNSTSSPPKQQD